MPVVPGHLALCWLWEEPGPVEARGVVFQSTCRGTAPHSSCFVDSAWLLLHNSVVSQAVRQSCIRHAQITLATAVKHDSAPAAAGQLQTHSFTGLPAAVEPTCPMQSAAVNRARCRFRLRLSKRSSAEPQSLQEASSSPVKDHVPSQTSTQL